jgi:hypothetical protein
MLEAIVYDLSQLDPDTAIAEGYECVLCGDTNGNHDELCPWRRAREWVAANPGGSPAPRPAPVPHRDPSDWS